MRRIIVAFGVLLASAGAYFAFGAFGTKADAPVWSPEPALIKGTLCEFSADRTLIVNFVIQQPFHVYAGEKPVTILSASPVFEGRQIGTKVDLHGARVGALYDAPVLSARQPPRPQLQLPPGEIAKVSVAAKDSGLFYAVAVENVRVPNLANWDKNTMLSSFGNIPAWVLNLGTATKRVTVSSGDFEVFAGFAEFPIRCPE
jgi:hypothetical protein